MLHEACEWGKHCRAGGGRDAADSAWELQDASARPSVSAGSLPVTFPGTGTREWSQSHMHRPRAERFVHVSQRRDWKTKWMLIRIGGGGL